jgi:hypothetical protein
MKLHQTALPASQKIGQGERYKRLAGTRWTIEDDLPLFGQKVDDAL